MPYPGLSDGESQELDGCVEKVMAKGHDKGSAIGICRTSMNLNIPIEDAEKLSALIDRFSFEPFGSLDGVLKGEPIRVFPTGKWYRDERVLDLQPARLQEFARNIKQGLPRFEIPINIEHEKQWGRYGSVHDLEYMENGPDGPGLYATKYELTPEGKRLVEQEKFKGVSGEAMWSLFNGAAYQDPKTGGKFDNVLVGMALTNSSFFGKDVAMFTAMPDMPMDEHKPKRPNGYTALRTKFAAWLEQMLTELGPDTNDDSQPDEHSVSTEQPDTARGLEPKGKEDTMANPITPTPPAPEIPTVSAETFAAYQAEQKALVEKMAADLAASNQRAEATATQLKDA